VAAVATVGTGHALLALGDTGGLTRAQVSDAVDLATAVTALDTLHQLLLVLVGELSTGGLHTVDLHTR
jgi:hypothetical protein